MGKHGVSSGNRIIRDGTHWEYSSFHGVHLRNVCYLGLDNNYLEGTVPAEFGTLEFVNELNLENNNLSGKVPFSVEICPQGRPPTGNSRFLKLAEIFGLHPDDAETERGLVRSLKHDNPLLCMDEGLRSAKVSGSLGNLKLCTVMINYKSFIIIWFLGSNGDDEVTDSTRKGNSNSFT
nr:piriformospora indica-insensitive protein 2-like [Ipomoea batatas]